jgi:CheY-like chemotaxis protein
MKSCRCAQCNVSSARYAWGFALLARDGWAVSVAAAPITLPADAWLCPACCERARSPQPGIAKPSAKKSLRDGGGRHGKLRVLLVDDDDIVRRCTARTLSDFEVVSVASGTEALELLQVDSDFDAVLSDVMMPRMSGPEFYERCYALYPLLARRFVFASGNPDSARIELRRVVQSVRANQAPILLAKPSPREALLLALFAAASATAARSGTFAIVEPVPLEVTKYRG